MQTYTGLRGTGTSFLTRGYALNLQVKIPEFDEVFNECKKPLNTIVKLNNDLYAYLDGVKIRAFCLMGQSKITLTLEVSAPRTSLAGVHLLHLRFSCISEKAQFSSSISTGFDSTSFDTRHRFCFFFFPLLQSARSWTLDWIRRFTSKITGKRAPSQESLNSGVCASVQGTTVTCDLQKLKDEDFVSCLADELAKATTGPK